MLLVAATATAQVPERLTLAVAPGTVGVDAERVRAAVASELGTEVALRPAAAGSDAGAALRVTGDGRGGVVVTFESRGRVVTRTIPLPPSDDAAVEAVALLAGNVVRDEAAEILAALRAARRRDAGGSAGGAETTSPDARAPTSAAETGATAPSPARREADEPIASSVGAPPSTEVAARRGKVTVPAPVGAASRCSSARLSPVPVGGDVAPFAGSSTWERGSTARELSFNVVGYVGGVRGIEVGALANVDTDFACGIQLAGGATLVGGPVRGLQLAGLANLAAGLVVGVQVAPLNGAMDVNGVQAGVANLDLGSLEGLQVGVAQLADRVAGAQIGMANGARTDVEGTQIGLVNVAAGSVHGAQIGLVNYAGDSDASIGLLSIVRHGRTEVQAWGSDWQFFGGGIKHGGRRVHGILGGGVRPPMGEGAARGVVVMGLGTRLSLSERLTLDIDLVDHELVPSSADDAHVSVASLGLALGVSVVPSFTVFFEPTYNVVIAQHEAETDLPLVGGHAIRDQDSFHVHGWPGLVAGARFDPIPKARAHRATSKAQR